MLCTDQISATLASTLRLEALVLTARGSHGASSGDEASPGVRTEKVAFRGPTP